MENHPIREQDNININFIKETEYVSFLEQLLEVVDSLIDIYNYKNQFYFVLNQVD